ncbi:predicted enzyme related to lactoylglutathione lyase [Alloalcanivorax xenomutans]|jgi:predicted enzyme related to lactoylglutathione lyase|uniref:VOC family protein n=1 Tax=Alloalcanivorax xenomutans TaxID=1094342 RepID=UPI000BD8FF3B|nr:VOC family protein [Alloalcanivorax xenomutans]SOC25569.1 predicted enzyme related to lactoylglutathione lyase [Alloalcanivorax xenomutans]|tara:strand:- start:1544 stop:1954 length:411 start_codon:yes stop_codon:yes gene_type:complete
MKVVVNIDVPELGRAIEFYCAALGLRHSRTLDNDVAELTGASSVIYLLQKPSGSKAAETLLEPRCYARHWTPVHIDFVVDDIEQAAGRALRAGAVRESEGTEWRASKCITFSDPFGHGFCLIEFAGETYSDTAAPD